MDGKRIKCEAVTEGTDCTQMDYDTITIFGNEEIHFVGFVVPVKVGLLGMKF